MPMTQQLLLDYAAAIVGTGDPLDPTATWVGVASAIANKGLLTMMSDVTEATGAMATRKSLAAWNGPFINTAQGVYYQGPSMIWKPASSTESQTIGWWFLADALTAGHLLYFGQFPQPYNLLDQTFQVTTVVRMNVPSVGTYDLTQVFNG